MKFVIELDFGNQPIEREWDFDDLRECLKEEAQKAFKQIDRPRYDYLYPKIKINEV